jgi:hypothetical protein
VVPSERSALLAPDLGPFLHGGVTAGDGLVETLHCGLMPPPQACQKHSARLAKCTPARRNQRPCSQSEGLAPICHRLASAILPRTKAHRIADLSQRHTDHRGDWRFSEDAWEDSRTRVSGPTQWATPMPTLRTPSQCSAIEG